MNENEGKWEDARKAQLRRKGDAKLAERENKKLKQNRLKT